MSYHRHLVTTATSIITINQGKDVYRARPVTLGKRSQTTVDMTETETQRGQGVEIV